MKKTDAGEKKEGQEKERRHDVEPRISPTGRARKPTGKSCPEFFRLIFRSKDRPATVAGTVVQHFNRNRTLFLWAKSEPENEIQQKFPQRHEKFSLELVREHALRPARRRFQVSSAAF